MFGLPSSEHACPLLIRQLLHTPLATCHEQSIVYRDRVRYNYRTLLDRIGRLASGLQAINIEPGDTIAVMDWDSHRYLESYFAIPMMGAVLMTVNVRLSPEQIAYSLNHSAAKVLLINADFLPIFAQIRDRLDNLEQFVLIDDTASLSLPEGFSDEYEALLAAASPDFVFPDFDENMRATTFYTTGTTGRPKGVCFSHRQIVLHTLATAAALTSAPTQGRIHRDDVYMPMTPMFHAHAWGMPYIATMLGLKQVYPGRYVSESLIDLIERERVTFSHGVPTLLQMVLSCTRGAAADLSGWKVLIGGSALPRGLVETAVSRGIDVFAGYGMSETCPVLTLSNVKTNVPDSELELDMRTWAGLPIPLVELRIVDNAMREVAHDGKSCGEIVANAPWLALGYVGDAAASDTLWAGGYLHTNDIGVIDKNGYLRVTDRIKDVIKTGGEWISSLELENLISLHPAVSEVAVIGIGDAKWGERPLPLIVLKAGKNTDLKSIQRHLNTYVVDGVISKYAVPDRVEFVDFINKTGIGKFDKKMLREKYRHNG
ncbi:long-chain fatty acid--CoA ligase [Burkholderia ubonensis]|nr:long-chain fatty acid--CoA ligase [Burkholderia ubonensis]